MAREQNDIMFFFRHIEMTRITFCLALPSNMKYNSMMMHGVCRVAEDA